MKYFVNREALLADWQGEKLKVIKFIEAVTNLRANPA
jgi:hypothetical protein